MQRVRFCYMPLGLFGTEVHAEVRPPWVALSKGLRLPLLRKHGRLRQKAWRLGAVRGRETASFRHAEDGRHDVTVVPCL